MQTIESLEGVRQQKQERMEAINKAAAEEGRTKSESEREEYGTLRDDIAAIDLEIKDLKDMEAIAKRAVPVSGGTTKDATDSRSTTVRVNHPAKPEPGIQFARLAMCLAKAKGNPLVAHALLQRHYPNHPALPGVKLAGEMGEQYGSMILKAAEMRTKAAVDGGTTATGSWTNALLAHDTFAGDFIELPARADDHRADGDEWRAGLPAHPVQCPHQGPVERIDGWLGRRGPAQAGDQGPLHGRLPRLQEGVGHLRAVR